MYAIVNLNAVLAATTFNPSIFSPAWLVKQGLVQDDELSRDFVLSPARAQFTAGQNAYLIVPNRAEISYVPTTDPKVKVPVFPVEDAISSIKSKIEIIIDKLPHTPYNAIGFNFAYICSPDNETPGALLKRVFYQPVNYFMNEIGKSDFNIGTYIVQKWQEATVKIEVKPTQYSFGEGLPLNEGILVDLNFHFPAADEEQSLIIIKAALDKWLEAEQHANEIVLALMRS